MKHVINLVMMLIFLTACAQQQEKSSVLIPVEERNVPVEQVSASPTSIEREQQANDSVIIALIVDAEAQQSTGNTENAVAILERGLRIEPANAMLWHKLAIVRLQQQQWRQAISLARKSIALTSDDDLKSVNWGVIADAYQALGDIDKERQARQKQKLTG